MPVVMDHPVDDEHVAPIPRQSHSIGSNFGVMDAKKHPPYVFSIRGVSCVVHKISRVEIHWWRIGGHRGELYVKLKRPVLIAQTPCCASFRLEPRISRTCHVPSSDAVLCGRCHGEPASFGKQGAATEAGIRRQVAHVKLGCIVQGY